MELAASQWGGTAFKSRFVVWKTRTIFLAVGLQGLQVLALVTSFHALLISDVVQLLLPLAAVACCGLRGSASRDLRRRRSWWMLGAAFAIWTTAEISYLLELYLLPKTPLYSSMDDVLWLLFAVPLLFVLSESHAGEMDWVSGLDRGQAFLFFGVVTTLVFSRPQLVTFDQAYDIQNLALLLSCLLRYSAVETDSDRNFFNSLGMYLLVYFGCGGVGNALTHRGWHSGGAVDLFWNVPITTFCLVTMSSYEETVVTGGHPPRPGLARHVHDLCALGLAVLSIMGAIDLLLHRVLSGSIWLVLSFGTFASRTWARERQLHRAHDSLQHMVFVDALTGLGNRMLLREKLAALLNVQMTHAAKARVALLFIDLDRFKAINDGLGHEAGDRVLVEVADRIQRVIESDAVACRLGGDEFVILFPVATVREAESLASRLLNAIKLPFWLDSKVLQVSGSIGVVLGTASDQPDELLRQADHAMYRAKKLGKDRVQFSLGDLSSKVRMGYQLETDLRECLNQKTMGVYLQPIFSLRDSAVGGFEALARWCHPQLGIIAPGDFIPIAEDTGMIVELSRQVLIRACRAVAHWNRTWDARMTLSVNVSARQFSNPDLLPGIFEILAQTGMDPHLLILEVTESVLMVGDSTVAQVLADAQRHGLEISLDDFGTGYSSLSHLLNFPTDEIKIDCTFVQGLDHDGRRAELVRTVLHLGRSLNKRVIAEGVETQEELTALCDMGCEYVQGYLFSKPFPAEELGAASFGSLAGFMNTLRETHGREIVA